VINELVKAHHAEYREDLPYWISRTSGRDPVLELGCGHGRVTLPLRTEGRKVFGLELAIEPLSDLINTSRITGAGDLFLVLADMLKMPLEGEFGAVIIPCNTYSIFNQHERNQLLRQIFRVLSPGGIFISSVPNPSTLQRFHRQLTVDESEEETYQESVFFHPKTGNPVQVSSRLSPEVNSIRWEWIYDYLLPDGTLERFIRGTEHQLSSVDHYQSEFLQTGFSNLNFLGDFEGSGYQDDSEYLIMECTRS
jgi:SAM-dependent methyltransferase